LEADAKRLAGKVAVITGGSSGIGEAATRLFAEHGAEVVVAARGAVAGQRVADEIANAGGSCLYVPTDVASPTSVADLIETVEGKLGRVDVLYSNAGLVATGTAQDTATTVWDEVVAVNLTGQFYLAKYGLPALQRAGGGVVIFTASDAALSGERGMVAYCAAKAGVINMARAIAVDCAGQNIRVNCIVPGGTQTPMFTDWLMSGDDPAAREAEQTRQTLLGRIAAPAEVARAALFLASQESSFMTGSVLVVDGGVGAWHGF
jgi:NAD(P)-dependent dehydrogenase (short-subunit alcohol dehydrogenase family)